MQRPIRLVSVLGLGPNATPPHYTPTVYLGLNGDALGGPTPLVQEALCRQSARASVHLLVTSKVRERWADALLDEHLPTSRLDGSSLERLLVDIPDGNSTEDQWRVFETVVALLDAARDKGEDIDVDVTHGFRILPMLVIAAANFARARWRMRDALSAVKIEQPRVHILYGAFDAKDKEGRAPIWDLTGVLGAADWADALRAFLSFERGDDLEALAASEAKALPVGVEQAARGALKGLGKRVKVAANDLVTARTANLLGESLPSLVRAIEDERQTQFASHRPILHETLQEFSVALRRLTSSDVGSLDGVEASLHLSELLGRMQRFSEQATLLRETAVTLLAITMGQSTGVSPGLVDRKAREKADSAFGEAARRAQRTKTTADALAHSLSKDRNDIQHAGLNPQPAQATDLMNRLSKALDSLRTQLEAHRASPKSYVARSPLLVNLSNHPLETWTPSQLAEGEQIAPLTDLEGGFPLVDPDLSTQDVTVLATRIAAQAITQGATAAAVFGEPVLTFALVSELESAGVTCWAPAGRRHVASERTEGAAIHTERAFEFHAWRRYRHDD